MLKLPTFSSINQTLSAWGRELRSSGVVTVGRSPRGVPQFNPTINGFESKDIAELGEGWTEWTPSIMNPVVVSNVTFVHSRYQIVAKTFFSQGLVRFTVATGPLNYIEFRTPVKLFAHPARGILCGMTDERNLTTALTGLGGIGVNAVSTSQEDTPIRLQTNVAAWATSDVIEIFWDLRAEVTD